MNQWHDENTFCLKKYLSDQEFQMYYRRNRPLIYADDWGWHSKVATWFADRITELETIARLLRDHGLGPGKNPSRQENPKLDGNVNRVFVVHGHDEGAKESIARFLEKCKIHPIILHEQVNGGLSSVLEKLERHSGVQFAVVLLTPDDSGGRSGDRKRQPRARQNVWLELGWFAGRLGRDKVLVLMKYKVEIPSDVLGLVIEPLDDAGGWKQVLLKNLRAAGFEVGTDALLS